MIAHRLLLPVVQWRHGDTSGPLWFRNRVREQLIAEFAPPLSKGSMWGVVLMVVPAAVILGLFPGMSWGLRLGLMFTWACALLPMMALPDILVCRQIWRGHPDAHRRTVEQVVQGMTAHERMAYTEWRRASGTT